MRVAQVARGVHGSGIAVNTAEDRGEHPPDPSCQTCRLPAKWRRFSPSLPFPRGDSSTEPAIAQIAGRARAPPRRAVVPPHARCGCAAGAPDVGALARASATCATNCFGASCDYWAGVGRRVPRSRPPAARAPAHMRRPPPPAACALSRLRGAAGGGDAADDGCRRPPMRRRSRRRPPRSRAGSAQAAAQPCRPPIDCGLRRPRWRPRPPRSLKAHGRAGEGASRGSRGGYERRLHCMSGCVCSRSQFFCGRSLAVLERVLHRLPGGVARGVAVEVVFIRA